MNDFDPLNNLFPKPREEIINMQSYSAPLENRRNLLRLDFNENTLGRSARYVAKTLSRKKRTGFY